MRHIHRRPTQPRFLSEIRPTEFNYPIAIHGKWHGKKDRFLTRYRSDDPHSYEPEFEAPFARRPPEITEAARIWLIGEACVKLNDRGFERRDPNFDERKVAVVDVYAAAHMLRDLPEAERPGVLR